MVMKKDGELVPDSEYDFKKQKRHSIKIFKLMASSKMSWATGAVYHSLWSQSMVRYPQLELNEDEMSLLKEDYKFDSDFLNYHIRNMKKLNLVTTIYEFESDGKILKVNNYKAALKLGIRGMKRSYLILKDLGK